MTAETEKRFKLTVPGQVRADRHVQHAIEHIQAKNDLAGHEVKVWREVNRDIMYVEVGTLGDEPDSPVTPFLNDLGITVEEL
jgi:hypothetical protein